MIFVLLPVYNEEKNIKKVLDEVVCVLEKSQRDFKIVVVDDGSIDNTNKILAEYQSNLWLEIIHFKKNKGIGCVFRFGIKRVCEIAKADDLLISLDCDQTHPVETFERLIDALDSGCDVAIASRYHPESKSNGLPFFRMILSDGVNLILRFLFPAQEIKDYSTFYRAYRIKILKQLISAYGDKFIDIHGFAAMAQILIRLARFKPKINEVPVNLRYDLRAGKSKMKIFKTVFEYLALVAKESGGGL